MDPRGPTTPPAPVGRVVAAAVVALAASLLLLQTPPARAEGSVARVAYDLPPPLTGALEVVMQAGSRAAIPVLAVVLFVLRRVRAALAVLVGGWLAWALAVVAKELVDRPRPTGALLGRSVREVVEAPGYPSSHAAIAAALAAAVILGLRLRPAPATAAVAVVVLTAVARVHLGVHWPLDVVGGAALGVAAGAVAVGLVAR